VKRLYSQREVSRLLSIPENQIRYWDRTGLIPCLEKAGPRLLFDFKGLIALRTIRDLLEKGVSIRRIRKCMEKLKSLIPEVQHPLSEIRIFIYGDQLVLCKDNLRFTPDGQLLMDFDRETRSLAPLPVDPVKEVFFQALEKEQQGNWLEAKNKYEAILAMKPGHGDALVNMGNLMYQQGRQEEAEACYREALSLDPCHVEANYNLANLLEEREDLDNAALLYRKALREDPEFADAHFNLARILEKAGRREEAREHWSRYLDLDPVSEWAEHARKQLESS